MVSFNVASPKQTGSPLVQCLDIAHAPRLVENRELRAVEAEHDEPLLAGLGLHPVQLVALGWLGAEVDVDRPIGVHFSPNFEPLMPIPPVVELECSTPN
jgi:hypothetical protein